MQTSQERNLEKKRQNKGIEDGEMKREEKRMNEK